MGLLWGLCAHRGWPMGIQPLERHRASTGSCRAPRTGGPAQCHAQHPDFPALSPFPSLPLAPPNLTRVLSQAVSLF